MLFLLIDSVDNCLTNAMLYQLSYGGTRENPQEFRIP